MGLPVKIATICKLTNRVEIMFLEDFYRDDGQFVHITPQQGSDFAKEIAHDFNPIHDADSKRFCVPGDLLFSLVLSRYGLSKKMHFAFLGMVGEDTSLVFPDTQEQEFKITDKDGRAFLGVERTGETSTDQTFIAKLVRTYVEFSGQTFPHILVPLMREKNAMINPDRPLVVYENMKIDLGSFSSTDFTLELTKATLEVNGRRGNVQLGFELRTANDVIGCGEKNMVLSGLREFDEDRINQMIAEYKARKDTYITRETA